MFKKEDIIIKLFAEKSDLMNYFMYKMEGHDTGFIMTMSNNLYPGIINDTYDLSIIHLPIDILNPGESVTVPLWIRGHKIGTSQCKFVFYYEPVRESFIKYRVCREEAVIEVIPSVKISYWVNPSVKNEHRYTLGIQFHGLQNEIGFNLLQITSASAKWKIEPLSFSNGKNNRYTYLKLLLFYYNFLY